MFKGIRDLFRKKPARPSDTPAEDEFSELRWIEAADNPFGIRVLDCRPVALRWISTTSDPAVAQRFLELRASLGTEHVGQVPNDAVHAECDLSYPADGRSADGPLFIAEEMEDKWNIYLHAGCLYFARSWTGALAARARLTLAGSAARIDSVDVDGSTAGDPELAIRHVDYLVKSHLYNKLSPHPLPQTMEPIERDIALYSFSLYGRRGQFASYEDTTRVRVS